jgi:hypothetical protein
MKVIIHYKGTARTVDLQPRGVRARTTDCPECGGTCGGDHHIYGMANLKKVDGGRKLDSEDVEYRGKRIRRGLDGRYSVDLAHTMLHFSGDRALDAAKAAVDRYLSRN